MYLAGKLSLRLSAQQRREVGEQANPLVFDGQCFILMKSFLGSVRLLQPIIPLFKQIESTETMSRCSRAPPKRINTDLEKYNSGLDIFGLLALRTCPTVI